MVQVDEWAFAWLYWASCALVRTYATTDLQMTVAAASFAPFVGGERVIDNAAGVTDVGLMATRAALAAAKETMDAVLTARALDSMLKEAKEEAK
jgi:hypothetical protein